MKVLVSSIQGSSVKAVDSEGKEVNLRVPQGQTVKTGTTISVNKNGEVKGKICD